MALDNEAVGQGDCLHIGGDGTEFRLDRRGSILVQAPRQARSTSSDLSSEVAFPSLLKTSSGFRRRYCVIVVGEGLVDADGNYVSMAHRASTPSATFSSAAQETT